MIWNLIGCLLLSAVAYHANDCLSHSEHLVIEWFCDKFNCHYKLDGSNKMRLWLLIWFAHANVFIDFCIKCKPIYDSFNYPNSWCDFVVVFDVCLQMFSVWSLNNHRNLPFTTWTLMQHRKCILTRRDKYTLRRESESEAHSEELTIFGSFKTQLKK